MATSNSTTNLILTEQETMALKTLLQNYRGDTPDISLFQIGLLRDIEKVLPDWMQAFNPNCECEDTI